ncbi:MAG: hypothetical protein QM756_34155 [Polyangiaceae bacterium]
MTKQKLSYEYPPGRDLRDDSRVPAATAKFLLGQVAVYGPIQTELAALIRAHRELWFKSSMGACSDFRAELARRLVGTLSCEDKRALRYYFENELARRGLDSQAQLAELGAPVAPK